MGSEMEQGRCVMATRHKCSACYKQYKKKEHLIEHMRVSYHSFHQPKCGVCRKHCKTLESVREHLTGPLAKSSCAKAFVLRGCNLCLKIFESSDELLAHKEACCLSRAFLDVSRKPFFKYCAESRMEETESSLERTEDQVSQVVVMDCEMVGGGSDGSLDLCARVCLIDESENLIFNSYIKPQIPVTNYRYEITGITEENLVDAMPLNQARCKIEEILYNGESIGKARVEGGRARILVGHDLDHDLYCLNMHYPAHLLRDTAKYPPLMRTNLLCDPIWCTQPIGRLFGCTEALQKNAVSIASKRSSDALQL
uniref:RNA exonuclease 4 n=1 Tax=Anthurium amnicola TaxID=1678845 RepID=A0A1D1XTD7_9ARAE